MHCEAGKSAQSSDNRRLQLLREPPDLFQASNIRIVTVFPQ